MPTIQVQVRRFSVVSGRPYASMASLIAPYGSEATLAVARDLDAKIETLLNTATQ